MKRPFLTAYDYGQRAVWCIIQAESREAIVAKYPDLTVLDQPPESMTDETLRRIRERMTFEIDDTHSGFLAALQEGNDRPL
jgi:hypothetical protein